MRFDPPDGQLARTVYLRNALQRADNAIDELEEILRWELTPAKTGYERPRAARLRAPLAELRGCVAAAQDHAAHLLGVPMRREISP